MVKILQIGLAYTLGGIEQFMINYGQNINKERITFDFINVFEETKSQKFYEELLKIGQVYDIDDYRKHPFKSYKQLKKIINEGKYDIIHYNMNSAVFLLPLICAKNSNAKRVIAHSHNSDNDKGIIKSIVHFINKHFITFFASDYFACSEKAAKWFFSKKTINSDKFKIINNAIDIDKFQYNPVTREQYRRDLNLNNSLVIAHVGRFNKQKNHEKLIEIFKEIHEIENNSTLLLIGDGILRENIQDKVEKLGLSNNVKFLGIRKDVSSLLQAADVFVFPSLYEGLGMVLIEAQASGLPCFTSKDVVPDEAKVTSLLNFIDLEESAGNWAKEIVLNYKKYERRNTNREITERGYNIKNEALRLGKIYESLVKESE